MDAPLLAPGFSLRVGNDASMSQYALLYSIYYAQDFPYMISSSADTW